MMQLRINADSTQICEDRQLDAESVVAQLRNQVAEKTKITVSAGIGPNATIAKIASNKNKPNGQCMVANDRTTVMNFMRDLPVRKVNGVGRVFERELDAIGVKTCGDIFDQRAYLARLFGDKAFHFLLNCFLGLGRTRVQPAEEYGRKSVGTESTFHDMGGKMELRAKLRSTAEELEKDLARTQVKGRTLVLKIKLHTYEVFTRQVVLPKAVHLADELYNYALPMLAKLEKEMPDIKLRLMGLRATNLVSLKKEGLDFFGVRSSSSDSRGGTGAKRKASTLEEDGTEWEMWPEDEWDGAAGSEGPSPWPDLRLPDEADTEELPLEERNRRRKHGKEILPNPLPPPPPSGPRDDDDDDDAPAPAPERWDCPICLRPQPAHDKRFNDHIDFCLSRQTIKEAVKDAAAVATTTTITTPGSGPGACPNVFSTFERARSRQRTSNGHTP